MMLIPMIHFKQMADADDNHQDTSSKTNIVKSDDNNQNISSETYVMEKGE